MTDVTVPLAGSIFWKKSISQGTCFQCGGSLMINLLQIYCWM